MEIQDLIPKLKTITDLDNDGDIDGADVDALYAKLLNKYSKPIDRNNDGDLTNDSDYVATDRNRDGVIDSADAEIDLADSNVRVDETTDLLEISKFKNKLIDIDNLFNHPRPLGLHLSSEDYLLFKEKMYRFKIKDSILMSEKIGEKLEKLIPRLRTITDKDGDGDIDGEDVKILHKELLDKYSKPIDRNNDGDLTNDEDYVATDRNGDGVINNTDHQIALDESDARTSELVDLVRIERLIDNERINLARDEFEPATNLLARFGSIGLYMSIYNSSGIAGDKLMKEIVYNSDIESQME